VRPGKALDWSARQGFLSQKAKVAVKVSAHVALLVNGEEHRYPSPVTTV